MRYDHRSHRRKNIVREYYVESISWKIYRVYTNSLKQLQKSIYEEVEYLNSFIPIKEMESIVKNTPMSKTQPDIFPEK